MLLCLLLSVLHIILTKHYGPWKLPNTTLALQVTQKQTLPRQPPPKPEGLILASSHRTTDLLSSHNSGQACPPQEKQNIISFLRFQIRQFFCFICELFSGHRRTVIASHASLFVCLSYFISTTDAAKCGEEVICCSLPALQFL